MPPLIKHSCLCALAFAGAIGSTNVLANGAVIMTSAICQDPRDAIDTLWVSRRYGANDVYFMTDFGNVLAMDSAQALDGFENLYVVSHGNADEIGDIAKADFAGFLHAAHPSTPATVYFDSCSAAVGNNTVLKLTNGQYGGEVKALYGPRGDCQLVGNNNPDVASAENRYDVQLLPGNQSAAVIGNIMKIWEEAEYVDSGMTWQAACETYTAQPDMASLNTFRLAVQDKFLNASIYPEGESHNYGLLIQWNTGGTNFFQCGQANGVDCP
ncbi:hypothetical protein JM93_00336 [Roseibium hamelinense]|uniref:DUF4347 domain-containing protein n=1 Tax=Roseibium hamelinense TaxID=150831 RepID=A0A562THY3_9HYPH|nr:hypothetical protein [Roseibium hamelinense]MTI46021.1 hypothetical protein [Roseibium hamelinense]TWI92788.1 hypothetical protein JM93_00336 [Roseibium hamelinense]